MLSLTDPKKSLLFFRKMYLQPRTAREFLSDEALQKPDGSSIKGGKKN